MPDKKGKESSGRQQRSKRLRQATLFESPIKPKRSVNDGLAPKPITPVRQKRKRPSSSSESSDIGAIPLEPVTPSQEPRTDEKRLHSSRSSRPQRRKAVVESESDKEEEQVFQGGSETDSSAKNRRQRLTRQVSRGSSSSKERSPPRRRLLSKRRKLKQANSTDEESSGDEVDEDRIIEPRFRARNKKTVFQKNLERLKRKKQGKPMSSSGSDEESEESEEAADSSQPFKGARPASSDGDSLFSGEDDSDGSSSFIVEDDSQAIATQLPTEFSMRSHDDLSHQFKVIFQFFVHITVRPAVDRCAFMEDQIKNQEYFSFPLKVTRRKLSGIRDSLVASSVWRPRFKKELEKFPTFELVPLAFAVPSCDACHLGGRLSTVMGRLGGIPYERLGFMDQVVDGSNEDSSDDSEGSSASATNFRKSKFGFLEFHLGRFCARRVRIYHEFSHWEYHLFHTILSELDDLHAAKAARGFVRVAFAGGRQPPTDLTDADAICDWLDERGLIDQEWHKMKKMMESAHHLELSVKKGEED